MRTEKSAGWGIKFQQRNESELRFTPWSKLSSVASLKETPGGVLICIRSAQRLTGGVSLAARAALDDRYQEIYVLDLLNS